jgi:ABC-type transport system involved in multi-copper enzyme maturation permease subunit
MPYNLGPGPVFIHESIAATRRWQLYATRALFVLGLLVSLAFVWHWMTPYETGPSGALPIRKLAALGQSFYLAIATVQIALVLLVAPAATARAICLDRARGTLTHMMVTDLTDAEIVLGKLAARLLPVLALVAANTPVLALSGLLGGIVLEAIVTLIVITVALAVFCSALALAFSVRATKTHEVLMAVYTIEAFWVLGPLVAELLSSTGLLRSVPSWLVAVNPFILAWAPYGWPKYATTGALALVAVVSFALSAGLVAIAILSLRSETLGRSWSRLGRLPNRLVVEVEQLTARRPRPSLDDDPVLWREWRRGRSTRLARIVWGTYIVLAVAGTAMAVTTSGPTRGNGLQSMAMVNGLQATFGLLLVSLAAPTILAEERVRGSLDVLMATPLPTERIVLGKWWGAFRNVPALVLLPAIGTFLMFLVRPDLPVGRGRFVQAPAPLEAPDRVALILLPAGLMLAQGGGGHQPRPGAGDVGAPGRPRGSLQRHDLRRPRLRLAHPAGDGGDHRRAGMGRIVRPERPRRGGVRRADRGVCLPTGRAALPGPPA